MWYVSNMSQAAPERTFVAPEWVLRGLLGALIVVVGLWLIPQKDSDGQVLFLAWLVLPAGGLVAGLRVGWLAVPAAVWLMLATYGATDCADCHTGGEKVATPVLIYAGFTGIFSAMALLGGGLGFLYRRGRLPTSNLMMLVVCTGLLVLFLGLVAVRWAGNRESSGDVMFTSNGIRYRAGDPIEDSERRIQGASGNLKGEVPLWLGEVLGQFNLSGIQAGPDNLLLVYGKCGPAPCTPPVTVMMRYTCVRPPEVEFAASPPTTRADGVVIVDNPVGGGVPGGTTKAAAWTGHLEVTIYSHTEAGDAAALVQQLRRVDGHTLEPAKPAC